MWQYLLSAIALIFVFEGLMPFISPQKWRKFLLHLIRMNDNVLRFIGLSSMLIGAVLMYLIHSGLLFN